LVKDALFASTAAIWLGSLLVLVEALDAVPQRDTG
jgi:hypothetical protein